jgi:glutathione S-transferase
MLTLHHSPYSVSAQKVRMVLAEKNLSWDNRLVDLLGGEQLGSEFRRLNPRCEVPVLVHDGLVLTESSLINEYLDETFPQFPLIPQSPARRYAMRHWVDWIGRDVHLACGVLTYAVLARPMITSMPADQVKDLLERIPDPATRAWRRSLLALGLEAPEVRGAIQQHREFFARLEAHLTTPNSWLAGSTISLADITALPYVMRAEHVGLNDLFPVHECPNLRAWYMRMTARPSMQSSFVDYFDAPTQQLLLTLVVAAQPQLQPLLLQ